MIPNAVAEWMLGDETGASSISIVVWMEALDPNALIDGGYRYDYPHDGSDLGRCIRLMDINSMYRERIEEMAYCSEEWAAIALNWTELEGLYRAEEPSGYAPYTNARMRELLDPIWDRRRQARITTEKENNQDV